jgi:hypothetical protein
MNQPIPTSFVGSDLAVIAAGLASTSILSIRVWRIKTHGLGQVKGVRVR